MAIVRVDFSEMKERGEFFPKRVREGEYPLVVTKAEVVETKSGPNKGTPQIALTITSPKIHEARYPYYLQVTGAAVWKLHNLLAALGLDTKGAKAVNLETQKLVGKPFGGTLEDEEWEDEKTGKTGVKSVIGTVFPISELDDTNPADVEPEDEEDQRPAATRKPRAQREETTERPARTARKRPDPEPEDEPPLPDDDGEVDLDLI